MSTYRIKSGKLPNIFHLLAKQAYVNFDLIWGEKCVKFMVCDSQNSMLNPQNMGSKY